MAISTPFEWLLPRVFACSAGSPRIRFPTETQHSQMLLYAKDVDGSGQASTVCTIYVCNFVDVHNRGYKCVLCLWIPSFIRRFEKTQKNCVKNNLTVQRVFDYSALRHSYVILVYFSLHGPNI
jgi:hypothetical protein